MPKSPSVLESRFGEPKIETLSEMREVLRQALKVDQRLATRLDQGEKKLAVLFVPIEVLFSDPESRITFPRTSGEPLVVTKENLQEHRALVSRFVRELRFSTNEVLKDLLERKTVRPLTDAEAAIVLGYEVFPDNPIRAHAAAVQQFVVRGRPLGTMTQLCQVLASINCHDEPVKAPPRENQTLILSELEVRKLIRSQGQFTITWKGENDQPHSLLITPENLEKHKLQVRDFMFSLRLRRNPELQRLSSLEQNGGLLPEEWIGLLAVRKHPDDPNAAYIEARELYLKIKSAKEQ